MLRSHAPVFAALVFLTAAAASAQTPASWPEFSGTNHSYDLSATRIVVIVPPDYNADEAVSIPNCWRGWGARVDFAGPARLLKAEKPGSVPPTVTVDLLLSEVDVSSYDLVYLPGGAGVGTLLEGSRRDLAKILDTAGSRGKVVAAICHGPLALTASGIVKGKRVTANGTEAVQALQQAGAIYVGDVMVSEGRLLTGQWPHFETFAVSVAEELQFPGGGGPFERTVRQRANRPPLVREIEAARGSFAFTTRAVPQDLVEQALQAAMRTAGRSSRGARTLRWVAMNDRSARIEISKRLRETSAPEFAAMGAVGPRIQEWIGTVLDDAPMLLAVFVAAPESERAASDATKRVDTLYAGGVFANFLLAARSFGLGVTSVSFPETFAAELAIKKFLQVPESASLMYLLAVGYPAIEDPPVPVRPASDILSYARWPAR